MYICTCISVNPHTEKKLFFFSDRDIGTFAKAVNDDSDDEDEEWSVDTSAEAVSQKQALVCLFNRDSLDASRERLFRCKMADNRFVLELCLPDLYRVRVNPNPNSDGEDEEWSVDTSAEAVSHSNMSYAHFYFIFPS